MNTFIKAAVLSISTALIALPALAAPQRMYWALSLPIIAVLIWSINIVVTRYVADFISPVSISFYRWFFAFILLTPFVVRPLCRQWTLIRAHLGQLAVLSAFGLVLYQGLAYTAAHYTTATNMGLINAFIPIFTIFVSLLILKDIPNRFAMIGSILSFAGLVYIIGQGNLAGLVQSGGHLGDVLMVVAEAALKSGSLGTAKSAAEQGKTIFAIPGHIYSEHHQGCHQLIREGAILVDHPEQIIEDLALPTQWHSQSQSQENTPSISIDIPSDLLELYNQLDWVGQNMDQLNFKLNTDIATLTSQLMELEILGLAQQQAGNYLRCRSSQ